MDSHSTEHGGQGEEHGIHLPDPSLWPLVVGLAALVAGVALIWWSRDRGNNFAGPLLGIAVAFLLASVGGWAYEDGRMRKKAEEGGHAGPRKARFTQVLTFAIPEGMLAAARASGGVVSALERSDLRDVDGFQDLRVTVSPAEAGPSQVIVETTWAGREGLQSYEGTRQTLLDRINGFTAQVVPGTVQAFDMEVVRDTKDTSFRFGAGAAATVIGALLVGGFALGAGLNVFQSDSAPASAEPTAPADTGADAFKVSATDNKFNKSTLAAPPETDVTFTFENRGKAKHNLAFFKTAGGELIAAGKIIDGGQADELKFKTPAAGNYVFLCEVHPDQMKGTFEVKAGAPASGGAAAGGASAAAGTAKVTATDNKFDKKSLEGAVGKEFTVTLENKGKAKHNLAFYDKAGGKELAPGATSKIIDGGQSDTIKFIPPTAGKFYFQCDVHPDQMSGDFTVK